MKFKNAVILICSLFLLPSCSTLKSLIIPDEPDRSFADEDLMLSATKPYVRLSDAPVSKKSQPSADLIADVSKAEVIEFKYVQDVDDSQPSPEPSSEVELTDKDLTPEPVVAAAEDETTDIDVDDTENGGLDDNLTVANDKTGENDENLFVHFGNILSRFKGALSYQEPESDVKSSLSLSEPQLQADITLYGDLDDVELELESIPLDAYHSTANSCYSCPCMDQDRFFDILSTFGTRITELEREVGIYIPEFCRRRMDISLGFSLGFGRVNNFKTSLGLGYSYANSQTKFSFIIRPEVKFGLNSFNYRYGSTSDTRRATVPYFDAICAYIGIRYNLNKDISLDFLPVGLSFGACMLESSNDVAYQSLLQFRYKNFVISTGCSIYLSSYFYSGGVSGSAFDNFNLPLNFGYSFGL